MTARLIAITEEDAEAAVLALTWRAADLNSKANRKNCPQAQSPELRAMAQQTFERAQRIKRCIGNEQSGK